MAEEIELNFRLDEYGRLVVPEGDADNVEKGEMDFVSKTTMTNLSDHTASDKAEHEEWLDNLLFDCDITDSGLMPRTFWMPSDGSMQPRCTLEQFALDIFHHHVQSVTSNETTSRVEYDPSKSGAEWWVQIRPSPEGTGRYSMHDPEHAADNLSKNGISWHLDKDEDLRLMMGGDLYIHPYLSTVTYLTNYGCPTVSMNVRVNNLNGDWIIPGLEEREGSCNSRVEAFCSWPKTGKHLSFDGRYLHGAIPDFMEPGEFDEQCCVDSICTDLSTKKKIQRRHRRVTFLVNIWLNFKPFNVHPFPEGMISMLSGSSAQKSENETENPKQKQISEKKSLQIAVVTSGACILETKRAEVDDGGTTINSVLQSNKDLERFSWPLGDSTSEDVLVTTVPITAVRSQAKTGGDLILSWEPRSSSNKSPVFSIHKNEKKPIDTEETPVLGTGNSIKQMSPKRKIDEV